MLICTVTSPQKTVVYEKVHSVALPAFSGQMQVLSGHAESFILLRNGNVSLQRENEQSETIKIVSGECHIKDDLVTVLL